MKGVSRICFPGPSPPYTCTCSLSPLNWVEFLLCTQLGGRKIASEAVFLLKFATQGFYRSRLIVYLLYMFPDEKFDFAKQLKQIIAELQKVCVCVLCKWSNLDIYIHPPNLIPYLCFTAVVQRCYEVWGDKSTTSNT